MPLPLPFESNLAAPPDDAEHRRQWRVTQGLESDVTPLYPVRHFHRNDPSLKGTTIYGIACRTFHWDQEVRAELIYTADPYLAGSLANVGDFTEV